MHLDDPEFRLNYELERTLGLTPHSGDPLPSVIAIVGDLEEPEAFALLEQSFGSLKAGKPRTKQRLAIGERERSVRIRGKAQSQLGYAVPAPPPSDPKSYAYRLLLYIMTHGYEGRLGMGLINRRGLISYVGSSYNSDGHASWISMTMGVNPDKLQVV